MDSLVFKGNVEQILAKTLRRGDVVVMDNLSPPKGAGVQEAIEAVGAAGPAWRLRTKAWRRSDRRAPFAWPCRPALRLSFTHPADQRAVTFEAPIPKDFRATTNQLRRASG